MAVGDFVKGRMRGLENWWQLADIPVALALLWISLSVPQHLDALSRKKWTITVFSDDRLELAISRDGEVYALLLNRLK